jgi:CheY-like chemotaxis protein
VLDDILDFSKIEAGKLDLDQVEFELRGLLGEILKMLALRAQKKGLELTCRVTADVPNLLIGDPGRLRQILVNLVGNSIKFTEQGEVAVDVTVEPGVEDKVILRFNITDTGPGIPKEKQQTIFEAFIQADRSTTRRFGGTGLGLSISTRLVQMMGGQIGVESEPGKGSTFSFTTDFKLPANQIPPDQRLEAGPWDQLSVLVVDDNATNRRNLAEMLVNWRLIPETAESGDSALQALEQARTRGKPFSLILVDGHMPGMDGFALARKIHGRPGLAGAMIMMLTSDHHLDDVTRCRELGISVQLVKPITQSDLLNALFLALDGQPSGRNLPEEPSPQLPQGKNLRILLAEDNVVNQRVALSMLQKRGHMAVVANNGLEALKILGECQYQGFDAVLMDVQMPEMDGFETTAAIRAHDLLEGTHTPIIAMTAHAMRGDAERCQEAGMDGYVAKPIRAADLMEELKKYVPDFSES